MNTPHLAASYGWEACPESVRSLVNGILEHYKHVLGKNLYGFYLHGSLAMGCFNPQSSDIDFLAFVKRKLTTAEKKTIIDYLLGIDSGSPAAAPEMSIVTQGSLDNLVYPSPFELHYSNSWRERYLSGDVDWEEPRYDADLVMHYLAIRCRGICLYGKPIEAAFPVIPREMCIASLVQDFNWINEQFDTLSPTYIVLNPCRAIAFLREGTFMSKKEGGEWALANLPGKFSGIINKALISYTTAGEADSRNGAALREFLDYARKEIIRLSNGHSIK